MYRDYVERHMQIDVRELHRRGALVPGVSATMEWNRDGEPNGSIGCLVAKDKITLHYKCKVNGQKWEKVEQEIYLEYTDCAYGGKRPWFTCWCTRRVAVLYAAGKWFLCRKCYRLIHRSVNEGKRSRAYRKMLRIRKLLGYDSNIMDPILFKPKGMHYTTFRRLLDKYEAAEEIHSQPLINAFIRWGRKAGHPLCIGR
jgi:hypothetical protein